jgi:hypothetical protein
MATETTTPGSSSDTEQKTAAAQDQKQTSDATQSTETHPEKTFTQADIDKAIQDRLSREKRKADDEMAALKKSMDELAAFKKTAEEEKSKLEEERLQKEKEIAEKKGEFEKLVEIEKRQSAEREKKLSEELSTLRSKAESSEKRYQQTRVDDALKTAAKDAVNPEEVSIILKAKHVFTVSDDGNVIVDGDTSSSVDAIVQDYLKQHPNHAKSDFGNTSGAGSSSTRTTAGGFSFTPEQLKDSKFYDANRDKILEFFRQQSGG